MQHAIRRVQDIQDLKPEVRPFSSLMTEQMRLSKTRVPACDPEKNDEVIPAEQTAVKQTI